MARQSLVCGFGRNDATYKIAGCPFYSRWASMIARCYNHRSHVKSPSYKDCTVAPVWASFMAFKYWMEKQPWEGNQLDKDLLVPGNKVYGPSTCCFVSQQVNAFLSSSLRGKPSNYLVDHDRLPLGVTKQGKHSFTAHCSNPFAPPHTVVNELLGTFDTARAAHLAWRARKHQHACTYADQQTDPVVATALRIRFADMNDRAKAKAMAKAINDKYA